MLLNMKKNSVTWCMQSDSFLQICVYAEEYYIKHRHTNSRWNR
jgi:hypothetical protein